MIMTILQYIGDHKALAYKGMGSLLLMGTNWLTTLDDWLRRGSVIVGLMLALFTIYKIYLDIRIRNKQLNGSDNSGTDGSDAILRTKQKRDST